MNMTGQKTVSKNVVKPVSNLTKEVVDEPGSVEESEKVLAARDSYLKSRKYELVKELGQGGFGMVFLIKDSDKPYALKELKFNDFQLIEDTINEISIGKLIKNENLVKVIDQKMTKINNDLYMVYIVMEFCNFGDFRNFLEKRKETEKYFTEMEALDYMFQIANGLKSLHEHEIVHRDLKPENIFMNKDSDKIQLKIGDFGISKVKKDEGVDQQKTVNQSATPKYISPEILEGNFGTFSDIFTLGIIFYEILNLEYKLETFGVFAVGSMIKKNFKPDIRKMIEKNYPVFYSDLVLSMLDPDYQTRPSIQKIFSDLQMKKSIKNGEFKIDHTFLQNYLKDKIDQKDVDIFYQNQIDCESFCYLKKEDFDEFGISEESREKISEFQKDLEKLI